MRWDSIVKADEGKIAAYVDSMPEAIAAALERDDPVDRAAIETGRVTP